MPSDAIPSMSDLGIIPQAYYDLIARYVPGFVFLLTQALFASLCARQANDVITPLFEGNTIVTAISALVLPFLVGAMLLVLAKVAFWCLDKSLRWCWAKSTRDFPSWLEVNISGPDRLKELNKREISIPLGDRVAKRRAEVRMWQCLAMASLTTVPSSVFWYRLAGTPYPIWAAAVPGVALVVSLLGVGQALSGYERSTRFQAPPAPSVGGPTVEPDQSRSIAANAGDGVQELPSPSPPSANEAAAVTNETQPSDNPAATERKASDPEH